MEQTSSNVRVIFTVSVCFLQLILVMVGPKVEVGIERHLQATPLKVLTLGLNTFPPPQGEFAQSLLALLLSNGMQHSAHRCLQVTQICMLVSSKLLFQERK